MKAVPSLLACLIASGIAMAEEKSTPPEQRQANPKVEEQKAAYEKARDATKQAYLVTAQIRQRGKIIDPDPESGSVIVSSETQDKDELETYVTAKTFYLKAQAELKKLEGQLRPRKEGL